MLMWQTLSDACLPLGPHLQLYFTIPLYLVSTELHILLVPFQYKQEYQVSNRAANEKQYSPFYYFSLEDLDPLNQSQFLYHFLVLSLREVWQIPHDLKLILIVWRKLSLNSPFHSMIPCITSRTKLTSSSVTCKNQNQPVTHHRLPRPLLHLFPLLLHTA